VVVIGGGGLERRTEAGAHLLELAADLFELAALPLLRWLLRIGRQMLPLPQNGRLAADPGDAEA
jgi:hypothetical protein